MPNLWLIFLTGLLTGGFTCMAVQGGLLATTIAQQQVNEGRSRMQVLSVASFLIAKLVAYTLLGFGLGWVGSFFQLSLSLQAVLMAAVAVFMIGTALNLLEVHPVFRFFVITPPKFLTRLVRRQAKSNSVFAPALLGAFTVFIPCGTTQAMMALAITTRQPLWGALILLAFVLGTAPLFFLLGYSVARLKDVFAAQFSRLAAYAVLGMAVWNLNLAATLWGSPYTLPGVARNFYCTVTFCDTLVAAATLPSDTVNLAIQSNGYSVDHPAIKAGALITMHLTNTSGRGCTQSFTIPKLGIQKVVPLGTTATIQFTAPSQPGKLAYTCSMGMYSGEFDVVNSPI